MRALSIATLIGLLATGAVAQSVILPHTVPDFRQRMAACADDWQATPASARGTMTYRQFTTKCLQGQTARPIDTVAECRNGATARATAPEGACAYDGGVERWMD